MTQVWHVDPQTPQPEALQPAAETLRRGGLVAFPTETVYGLGADGLQPAAVRRIFSAKGRPSDNPLILHVASLEQAQKLMGPEAPFALVQRLAESFWPGPLTLIVPKAAHIPDEVTAGLDTVAVRVPVHPVARCLIELADRPIAAPSANRSGRPSPTFARHVLADLSGRIDGVVDGGPCGVGLESTVLDITAPVPLILRPGGITQEALSAALQMPVDIDPRAFGQHDDLGDGEPVRSPGMKYRHYAPSTPLLLCEHDGEPHLAHIHIKQAAQSLLDANPGSRIGLLLTDETAEMLGDTDAFTIARMGPRRHPERIAARLFENLRALDDAGLDWVVVEGIQPEGLGLAVMNRLRRAATIVAPRTHPSNI